ncbi:hypothetical protein FY034_18115 (plasmid) [Trichlorobacter lovleyi]|uniref:hypothetical protein n=1 Tax=Trichlorobacter lovleyi TaxID=313985 RepID=UPI002240DF81|nr:hypothetical protein [Trichlorobacter lovleyi]QOX80917.1 hypothetical protein FY034_18115 [Trichlorobacter lovleyi]
MWKSNKSRARVRQSPTSGESADRVVDEYEALLLRAYRAGYSVVFLQRYLASASPYFILNVLIARGEIPGYTRVNKAVYKVLPRKISVAFQTMNFNFVNWCDGWKISDFREAARLLSEEKDPQNHLSLKVHSALQNDYPDLYERVYFPGDADTTRTYSKTKSRDEAFANCTIHISYNKSDRCFTAVIDEIPDCQVRATTCDKAFAALKQRYAIIQQTLKLSLLAVN